MSIDDFVSNRWADAEEALRKLDPDFVDQLDSLVRLERLKLYGPPNWHMTADQLPKKRLPKKWHSLLEACYELTVQTRHYQTAVRNMTSEAAKGMSDIEAGEQFDYSFHTWVFYQGAVIEHAKTVITWVSKIYKSCRQSPNQLKKQYHRKADALKERNETERNAVVHGGGFTSQAMTEGQFWERTFAIGMLPRHFLDESRYVEAGRRVNSGYYDFMSTLPSIFFGAVASVLHDLENEIAAPD